MTRKSNGGFALAIAAGTAGLVSLTTTNSARAELVFYEPFNYLAGSVLHNQQNVSGTTDDVWTRSGTVAATSITVGSGSLSSPFGATSGEKGLLTAPATASTERLNFPQISSGSIFYSLTLNAAFGTENPNAVGGAYFCGLSSLGDNGDLDGGSAPAITNTAARLALRKDPVDATKYNIGITNTLAQATGNYSSMQLSQSTDVFVIVQLDQLAGASNDVAKLWINPNASTFQPTDPPSMTIDNASPLAADIAAAPQSFFLRQTGGLPQFVNVDEIRLGTSYTDVVPPPALTYYWDVNGTTGGAGGSGTPHGDWDGVENNFNTNAAGGSGTFAWDPTPADTVVFSAGGGATGNFTVSISGTRTAAGIVVEEGNVTLGGGTLSTPSFDVAEDSSAIVLSTLNGGGANSITKTGIGALVLASATTYTGGTTVNGGSLVVGNADALNGGSLAIATAASAQLTEGLPKAVTVSSVTTAGSGQLDITNNSMVVKSMTASAVQAQLASGYNAGAWNGPAGITSTTAAASTETSVGFATQAQLGVTEFKGVSGLDADDVLVKYTYAGDANLDGKVDIGDLGLLAGAWQQLTGKVWFDGDFTYDGAVNIGDLGLLAGNWQKGTAGNPNPPLMTFDQALAQFSVFEGVVVPEPGSLSLLALGGVGLMGRRRRRAV
jgi:autotransporter-associated beta strand protein